MTGSQLRRTLVWPAWIATRPLTVSGGSAVDAYPLVVYLLGPSWPVRSTAVTAR